MNLKGISANLFGDTYVTCKNRMEVRLNKIVLMLIITIIPLFGYSQECDCYDNYLWLKKTIEENDAGFEYAIQQKGIDAYKNHNEKISKQIKLIKQKSECEKLLNEWLHFFRSGHIGIYQINNNNLESKNKGLKKTNQFANWEKIEFNLSEFRDYLDENTKDNVEGIWVSETYKIGIMKQENEYIGFIIEADSVYWEKGQIKLRIPLTKDKMVYYMQDHSEQKFNEFEIIENAFIQSDFVTFRKYYPKVEIEQTLDYYFNALSSDKPFVRKLNESTVILRIPSFSYSEKTIIDSVIESNKDLFTQTENLIIDLRNNAGGSDVSYQKLIPLIYTNPIRVIGLEFLSTPINNKRMEDLITNSDFPKETREWAKSALDKLNNNIGEFVNLNESSVSVTELDSIYNFPKNVGILINKHNGSTTEQFLLAAKQSKKVKLFGVTTAGVLDISNMYFVNSPDNQFKLGYSLSKSMRIPDLIIDNKGIQPDYYVDKSIPKYKWIEFVSKVLNE